MVFPSFMAGFVHTCISGALITALASTPIRNFFLYIGILPNPSEGPSEAEMDKGNDIRNSDPLNILELLVGY
jgi:hypothetical protein